MSELTSVGSQVESQLGTLHGQLQSELASGRAELGPALPPPRDCSDLPADSGSGVYLLQPGLGQRVPAFCDQETAGGGWTVFQRRADIRPRQDFFRGWQDYKWGFGQLDEEFWWGLRHLAEMTSLLDRRYQLRIDMEDFDGERRYALLQGFKISSEADGYRLTVANYSGDAGDNFSAMSGIRFSTKDKDQDTYSGNCASAYKGGWWYTKCHASNLNGLYLSGSHESYADGINWHAWRGHHYSLKTVEMKIRPSKKL